MNSHVKIKICGITDSNTALLATREGADALGFVFAPSTRRVHVLEAKSITCLLPPFISRVGVFVNAGLDYILHAAKEAGLDTVQLHGDEDAGFCLAVKSHGLKVIKTVHLILYKDRELARCCRSDAVLLDYAGGENRGGSGIPFDWDLASGLEMENIILAGGLNVENVVEAIEIVRPYAVDISTGVETNGCKDHEKIRRFISKVRGMGRW